MESDIKNIKNILMNSALNDKKIDLSQLAWEVKDNIVFNDEYNERLENISRNNNLHLVNLSQKFKVYSSTTYAKNEVIIHVDSNNQYIEFYVLCNNYNFLKENLYNIYKLYTSKKYVNYILECERKVDIENLFANSMMEKLYEY